jgi:phosphatidylserine/phosphatidylglycerophosphate/cardiolipin synthase-like enzyme
MHKKCIIIDEALVWLGSTNLTRTSLKLHSNLFIALHSPQIAKSILEGSNFSSPKFDLEHTENTSQAILKKIILQIDQAKTCIHLAMFTFTHKEILQSLINAHKRGVKLSIYLDKMQASGCGRSVVACLEKHNILIKYNKSRPLLHHKLALIDNKTLITGSLNWTKAAFKKNKEIVLTIHNLDNKQKKTLHELLALLDK